MGSCNPANASDRPQEYCPISAGTSNSSWCLLHEITPQRTVRAQNGETDSSIPFVVGLCGYCSNSFSSRLQVEALYAVGSDIYTRRRFRWLESPFHLGSLGTAPARSYTAR